MSKKKESKKDLVPATPPTKNVPTKKKVISLLSSSGVTKKKICEVLAEGLVAVKPIVSDGEIISYEPDFAVRHKYVDTVLDVIGEKKMIVPDGDLHIHFTNILQQVRAYERGDERAVRAADKFVEVSGEGTEVESESNNSPAGRNQPTAG